MAASVEMVDVDAETVDPNEVSPMEEENDENRNPEMSELQSSVSVAAKESFLLESNPNTEDEHQISEQSVEKSDESEKDGPTQEKDMSAVPEISHGTPNENNSTENEQTEDNIFALGEANDDEDNDMEESEIEKENITENIPEEIEVEQDENVLEQDNEEEEENEKLTVFPLAKIKKIMRTDPDTHLISKEAILLTAKATELFLREFASFSYEALKETKRKTISKKEFDAVLELVESYCFLDGIFYEQTTASSAAAPQEIDESLDVENAVTTEIREKETTTEESTETSESLQTSDSLQQMEANKSEMSVEESQT